MTVQLGYKHTFCQNVVSTEQIACPHIFVKNNMLNFWSTEDWPRFSSPVKLFIDGLQQIAVS